MPERTLSVHLPPGRVFGLDLLRAAAILFVVYMHGAYELATVLPKSLVQLPIMDGVSMFFVLSGFLIGGIILRAFDDSAPGPRAVGRFWIRRWFRTLPNYFLVLSILTAHLLATTEAGFSAVWRYFLFVQNFASSHPPFFPEAWSLSIEEWFYIFLPLALLAMTRLGMRLQSAMLVFIVFTVTASLLFRYCRLQELETINLFVWDAQFRKQVVTRLDSIIYGVLGAYVAHYHPGAWVRRRGLLLAAGLALLLLHKVTMFFQMQALADHALYYSVFSFVVVSLGTLLLLPWLSQLQRGHGAFYRVVTLISLISYSMYLVHLSLVQRILVPWSLQLLPPLSGSGQVIVHYGLYWLYTVALSVLIYRYFELPAMNLRERFARGRG
jgi:peptidoglycan/LPS O-acetylase OafA/YrhL